MRADTLSLTNLFNKPVSYVVPLFQRPYVWTKDQHWQPLWEDLRLVAERLLLARAAATEDALQRGIPEEQTAAHFLGAIVVEQLPTGAGMIEQRRVIDGQQRLTTLQLLLDAAQDVAAEYGDANAKLFSKLTNNDPDLARSQLDEYKVWPTNIDRLAFRLTMGKDELSGDRPDVSRTSIWQAHEFFAQALREWLEESHRATPAERLDALRTVFWSLVRLVVIDLDSSDNAQVIFETLNARGTPLLASDLIKNSLFQQLAGHGLKVDDLYEREWKPLDADWWRAEITQGRLYRPRLDVFFFHWLTMRRGNEFGVHELFTQYKRYAEEQGDPQALLSDIAQYAKVFKRFESHPPGTAEEVFFYRLRATQTATATPLLLFVMGQSDDVIPPQEKRRVMEAVESWLIRRLLCRLTTKNYNIVFMTLLQHVLKQPERSGDIAASYLAEISGESQEWPTDEQVREAVVTLPLYRIVGRGRLRMILEALEDSLRPSGTVEEPHAPRGLTIEHVLPQAWKKHWPLDGGDNSFQAEARRDTLKHSFGNLTLVTNKLNPKLSHAPWAEKRAALTQHTVLFLNRDLVNEYQDRWDEETIVDRGNKLAALAIRIWPGPQSEAGTRSTLDPPHAAVAMSDEPPATSSSIVELDVDTDHGDDNSWSHDQVKSRLQNPIVVDLVDRAEEWLRSVGVDVRHKVRSTHALFLGNRRIGGYYFAKRWLHFSLRGRDSSDTALEQLSQPASLRIMDKRITGNVVNLDDFELFKHAVRARLDRLH